MTAKPQVQLNLTKEQYKTLVELVDLGQWMANATRVERIKKYDELEQLVFSFAKQAGLQDCVDYDEKLKTYFLLGEFAETVIYPLKDEYDDYTFWEELAHRLADRDLLEQFDEKEMARMPSEELHKVRDALVEKYEDESVVRGVERLRIAR